MGARARESLFVRRRQLGEIQEQVDPALAYRYCHLSGRLESSVLHAPHWTMVWTLFLALARRPVWWRAEGIRLCWEQDQVHDQGRH